MPFETKDGTRRSKPSATRTPRDVYVYLGPRKRAVLGAIAILTGSDRERPVTAAEVAELCSITPTMAGQALSSMVRLRPSLLTRPIRKHSHDPSTYVLTKEGSKLAGIVSRPLDDDTAD